VRGASRGDAFVFYCEHIYDVRLSFVDHNSVFLDAGYCEKQPYGDSNIDVGRDCAMNLFFWTLGPYSDDGVLPPAAIVTWDNRKIFSDVRAVRIFVGHFRLNICRYFAGALLTHSPKVSA